MINKDTFLVYANLEIQKRDLEERQKKLKPEILAMIEEAGKPIEVEGIGTFSIGSRPKWKYSDEVKAREEDLKKRKAKEEADGTAEKIEGEPYTIFKAI